jgi:MFS family permease
VSAERAEPGTEPGSTEPEGRPLMNEAGAAPESAPDDAVAEAEAAAAEGPAAAARPRSLWRNRDYMSWWIGSAISMTGTNMSNMAFPLLVLFTTGSAAKAGLIAAAERIGAMVTRLWGGALSDRISRKAVLVLGPLPLAALMGLVAWSVHGGHVAMPLLVCAAGAGGLIIGLTSGATLPAMRRIVPPEQFAARSAQEQGMSLTTQLLGAPLAGLLYTVARWLPFGVDALSFAFSSAGSALIARPLGPDPDERAGRQSMIADIREGIGFVRAQPYLRFTLVWLAVVNMVGNGFFLLFTALLVYRGGSPRMIGLASSLVLIGGVVGALLAGRIIARFQARRAFLAAGWIFAAGLALVAIDPAPWAAAATACAAATMIVPLEAIREAYAVKLVPDRLTGRVASVTDFGGQSLTWVGMLLGGALADRFGPPTALLAFAGLLVLPVLASHLTSALHVLRIPVAEVEELPAPPPPAPAPPGAPGRRPAGRPAPRARSGGRRPADRTSP